MATLFRNNTISMPRLALLLLLFLLYGVHCRKIIVSQEPVLQAMKKNIDISNKRLFSVSQTKMSDRKAVIKKANMSEEMQTYAIECATQALEEFNIEKDIAAYIKNEFDKQFNSTWTCIVGRNFFSYVDYEIQNYIYFYLGQFAILLFKSG